LRIKNTTTPPNQTPRQPTRKFATQVGNWRLFQQKANQHSQKGRTLLKSLQQRNNLTQPLRQSGTTWRK
jgi:hypothetical protein